MQPYLALITPLSRGGERPDHELPGGGGHPSHPIYHPGHPDHGRPVRPDNSLPGSGMPSWGGGWGSGNRPDQGLPGQGGHPSHGLPGYGHPDQGLPGGGVEPKSSLYAGVPESGIPQHPDKPNPEGDGEWVLVALGDRTMKWAWLENTEAAPKSGA